MPLSMPWHKSRWPRRSSEKALRPGESGGAEFDHGSGGKVPLAASAIFARVSSGLSSAALDETLAFAVHLVPVPRAHRHGADELIHGSKVAWLAFLIAAVNGPDVMQGGA